MPVYTIDSAYQKIREHFSRPDAVLGWDEEASNCVYRGGRCASSSVRCAVGVLIPDEDYSPEMEDCGSLPGLRERDEIRETAIRLFGEEGGGELHSFLGRVQDAHDSLAVSSKNAVSSFLRRLEELYREWSEKE